MLKTPICGIVHYRGYRLYCYDKVKSTNELLMKEARRGYKSGTVVCALEQTDGKGSKGRSFYSPVGGMYLSVLLRPGSTANASYVRGNFRQICPSLSPEDTALITPAAACAVADAMGSLSERVTGIKWVNDVYIEGKKVAGILTESAVDDNGDRFYVVGIGMNVFPPDDGFPDELTDTATSLFRRRINPGFDAGDMIVLRRRLLDNLRNRLHQITPRWFLDDYRQYSIVLGKDVIVTPLDGTEPYSAKAVNIDNRAQLVVRTESGDLRTLNAEDVSLSLQEKKVEQTNYFDISDRIKAK
ncbi:MAG: biotin--[acetyl-CoA-carboxylase] ligase [Oscillospiraceae bacterium]|nr:biotin--[acetyl-CoA-carboxylase] ligase [Oscillospiraceae bacterium]